MYTFVPPPPVECAAIVKPAGVPILVMWQLGRDTSHVPDGLDYPRGGWLEMDRDPEVQSRGYYMTSLQAVPCHNAGMVALSCWKRNCFQQLNKLAGHVDPHSFGCK